MSQKLGKNNNKVYKLVLTGGPCGGKTTGQARLCTFFENLGWKVFRVPETATVLMGGGVKWTEMSSEESYLFQSNLLKSMMQIEKTFFDLASTCKQNCLVICDRGTMDASAYMKPEDWEKLKEECAWNEVDLRDSRYNQVIHMISAAKGAEAFYQTETHVVRHEGMELARQLDNITSQAWVGHPYYDVIDNSTDFERKIVRMIGAVCNRLNVEAGDRLSLDSKKRKFLVLNLPEKLEVAGPPIQAPEGIMDEAGIAISNAYPQFQDFIVVHDYLVTPNQISQARIRKRGQNVKWDPENMQWNLDTGDWTYTHTIRRPEINKESPELKMQISSKEYELLLAQKDTKRYSIYKKRRCFLWNNQYFQMDIYQEPCHTRCQDLIILETYTTMKGLDLRLPDFLDIIKEVTDEPYFSMYNLARKDANVDEQSKHNAVKLTQRKAIKKLEGATNGHSCVENGYPIENGFMENGDHHDEHLDDQVLLNGHT